MGDSSTVELRTSDSVNLGSNPGPPANNQQVSESPDGREMIGAPSRRLLTIEQPRHGARASTAVRRRRPVWRTNPLTKWRLIHLKIEDLEQAFEKVDRLFSISACSNILILSDFSSFERFRSNGKRLGRAVVEERKGGVGSKDMFFCRRPCLPRDTGRREVKLAIHGALFRRRLRRRHGCSSQFKAI